MKTKNKHLKLRNPASSFALQNTSYIPIWYQCVCEWAISADKIINYLNKPLDCLTAKRRVLWTKGWRQILCPILCLYTVYVPVWETKPLFHTDLQSDSIPDTSGTGTLPWSVPVPGHPHKPSLSRESGAWWSGFPFGNLSMNTEISCHSLPFLNFSLPPTLLLFHHFTVNI